MSSTITTSHDHDGHDVRGVRDRTGGGLSGAAGAVIDRLVAARAAEQAAGVAQLEAAAEWARLHPCAIGDAPAGWAPVDMWGEQTSTLAGPGAPQVAEFAPAALGAALGISFDVARGLLGDAIELICRLPRLWAHAVTGRLPVRVARQIAAETRDLGVDAVAYADRLLAATPGRITSRHAVRLVDEARLYFDPDRAVEDERHAMASRGCGPNPVPTPRWSPRCSYASTLKTPKPSTAP